MHFLVYLIALFLVVYVVVKFLSKFFTSHSTIIGEEGEREVRKLLEKAFRNIPHRIYNNIILEFRNDLTQIDHIVISINGIYVVETKNLEGWIFGNENNKMWTQSLYGKNYKFFNPLRQNYKHTKFLEGILNLDNSKFEPIIVFTEYGEFKTDMPANVLYSGQLVQYVRSTNSLKLDENTLDIFANKLEEFILPNTKENIKRHKKHVRNIIEKKKAKYRSD